MPETAPEAGRIAGTAAGGETIQAPPGNTSASGEGGGDTIIGSSGDNRLWMTDRNDRFIEQPGGGTDTLLSYLAVGRLPDNVENLHVYGAFNYAAGNSLGNLITVDDNSHWIYGAGGDDVLVGAASQRTTFMVRAGEGSDVIYNWTGNSQLQLLGYNFTTAAQVKAAMSVSGADTVIALGNGETLTLRDTANKPWLFEDRQFLMPLDRSKLGALTFSDEFNSLSTWDPSTGQGKWRTDFGSNPKDQWNYTIVTNGETQVYVQPGFQGRGEQDIDVNPFSVNNGILTIRAERVSSEDAYAAWNRDYTSGMINTVGLFEQKYGYFEIRAELPTAQGSWPAFWLIPHSRNGQTEGDIMEALAATPNFHYARALGGGDTIYDNSYKIDPSGFHTYGLLWTPTTVTFYYDGVATLSGKTPANWTESMSMIVNLAVGGWGGNPNAGAFPTDYKIDYVRAYALADGSTQVVNLTPDPPSATLKDAGAYAGEPNTPVTFANGGAPVTSATIAVYASQPASGPAGKAFVIWEKAGAIYGAVSDAGVIGNPVALMAGSASQITGTGTWLTTGKVAFAYYQPDETGRAAWAMVYDPARGTFTRQELGHAVGDVRFVATQSGGFAVSWDAPGGVTMGRAYDEYAYGGDVPGWYGPARQLAGDITGVTASGKIIAGGQTYSIFGASVVDDTGGATPGNDQLFGPRMSGLAGDDTLTGTPGQDWMRGDEGNDKLFGGELFDDMHGNMGDDTLYGGSGDDWVVGGKDQDVLYGDAGADIVLGNLGQDRVEGGEGNDIVRGGQGDDIVIGGFGDDWIAGDRGNDTLTGGLGADIFHTFDAAGMDRVTDFNRADGDRVNLLPGSQYSVAQVGADVVVNVVGGAQMVLANVQLASLDSGWIYVG